MGPLRIIILAVLLYIGYRLLVGSSGKSKKSREKEKKTSGPNAKITDILVEDPICHKLVPKQLAVHLEEDGKTIYFCSEECCRQFTSEKGEDV